MLIANSAKIVVGSVPGCAHSSTFSVYLLNEVDLDNQFAAPAARIVVLPVQTLSEHYILSPHEMRAVSGHPSSSDIRGIGRQVFARKWSPEALDEAEIALHHTIRGEFELRASLSVAVASDEQIEELFDLPVFTPI